MIYIPSRALVTRDCQYEYRFQLELFSCCVQYTFKHIAIDHRQIDSSLFYTSHFYSKKVINLLLQFINYRKFFQYL